SEAAAQSAVRWRNPPPWRVKKQTVVGYATLTHPTKRRSVHSTDHIARLQQRREAAIDHALAVERHVGALEPRVGHHLLVDGVAGLAVAVDCPGKHHDLVLRR